MKCHTNSVDSSEGTCIYCEVEKEEEVEIEKEAPREGLRHRERERSEERQAEVSDYLKTSEKNREIEK